MAKNQAKSRHNGENRRPGVRTAPVARALTTVNSGPRRNQIKNGLRIKHKELVTSVNGSVAFSTLTLQLNPGLSGSFPWLSTVAGSYERYRFRKLRLHYLTRTSTATAGSILMAHEYDPSDAPPETEAQLGSFLGVRSGPAWADLECEADMDLAFPAGPYEKKIIREGPVSDQSADCAHFHFGTVDFAGSTGIGRLYVEYEVDLINPQISDSLPSSSRAVQYGLTADQSINASGVTIAFNDQEGGRLPLVNTSGVFTLPKGSFRVYCETVTRTASTTGQCVSTLWLNKNSVAIAKTRMSVDTASAGNTDLQVSASSMVSSDGTDTLSCTAFCNEASGTPVILGDSTRIFIEVL